MIIGLTGSYCAGKDAVAEYLISKYNFIHYSLSDILREELKKKRKAITRENLIKLGTELREKEGNTVLAERTIKKFKEGNNYIVSSIRHSAEIEVLQKQKGFYLIDVDAPSRLRFERMTKRMREEDPKTYEEFIESEKRESQTSGSGQQLTLCRAMAKIHLINDMNSHEILQKKVNKLLKDLGLRSCCNETSCNSCEGNNLTKVSNGGDISKVNNSKTELIARPDWDEYFMKMAFLIAERSTCRRHHIGAIVVRNKRVLTTGYNGAAAGTRDCLELGCLKNQLNIASGKGHETCRAIHAEQNAIIQGALHGTKLEGATIYCTHSPCNMCAKEIVNSGIKEVVSCRKYIDDSFINLFKEAKVKYRMITKPSLSISELE